MAPASDTPRRPFLLYALVGLAALALAAGAYWLLSAPPSGGPLGGKREAPEVPEDPDEAPSGPPWFADVTAGSGLDFTYRNGEAADQYTILESLGGGVALIDYDNDGLLDVFVTGGGDFAGDKRDQLKGHPCKLFRNLGNWKFKDVTADVHLDRVDWWYTHGAAVADFNRDGFPDLLVTGFRRLALFRNAPDGKGGRRFVDVTKEVGLKHQPWSTSAGWADLDGDGWPDLYVCNYLDWSFEKNPLCPGLVPGVKREVCPPQKFKPLVHAVFRNEKGKHFSDESKAQNFEALGCGLGVVLVDVNDDRKPDIYVGNDASNNFLFVNRSSGRLQLEEKGLEAGVAVNDGGHYDGSMGVDAGDYEGSGRASLWVTNFQGDLHGLYANKGGEEFEHRSRAAGIGALGQNWVGFGTGFLDADNDGWEDLVIVNGHVVRRPSQGSTFRQRPLFLRNVRYKGRRFFRDRSAQAGPFFEKATLGRGLAVGDLDNDGWPDAVISHTNGPVALLRNEAAKGQKPPHRWLGVRLKRKGYRDAVGSTVVVELEDGRRLTRFMKGGGSYLSANDPRLLFGLGPSGKVKAVTVKWSWGEEEPFGPREAGRYWDLREGEGGR